MKKIVFASLTLMMLISMSFKPLSQRTLLILKNAMQVEVFSVFNVTQQDSILIGLNTEDYPVANGLYLIEGTSNNKFYHKHIMITSK